MIVSNKCILILLSFIFCFFAYSKDFAVGVESLSLKSSPSFISKTIKKLDYGEKIQILKKKNDWYFVKSTSDKGWAHKSSLGKSKYILKDIGKGEKVAKGKYKENITLAGKGFSPEHEEQLKKDNNKLNFKTVDKVEKIKPKMNDIKRFAVAGSLKSVGE